MEAVGIDIPAGGTVFQARTAVIAMAVGVIVTIGSAVMPSIRGVPGPADGRAAQRRHRTAPHPGRAPAVEGGLLVAGGVGAFVAGLAGSGIQWVGIGALLTFVGAFVLGPVVARPTSRALGAPVARAAGVTGLMAQQNAVRNPIRTARTGGALMVGVALVAAITVIAASAKDWTHDVFGAQFTGDFVVSTDAVGFGGLSPELADRLGELPEVDAAAGVRVGSAATSAGEGTITYVSVDPAIGRRGLRHRRRRRSPRRPHAPTASSSRTAEADRRGLAVGDQLELGFLNGTDRRRDRRGPLHRRRPGGILRRRPRAARAQRRRPVRLLRLHRHAPTAWAPRTRRRHRVGERRLPERRRCRAATSTSTPRPPRSTSSST